LGLYPELLIFCRTRVALVPDVVSPQSPLTAKVNFGVGDAEALTEGVKPTKLDRGKSSAIKIA